jgi:hypothetical protein
MRSYVFHPDLKFKRHINAVSNPLMHSAVSIEGTAMHTTKTLTAPAHKTGSSAPWLALFALACVPLFTLQLSSLATLQMVVLLSLTMLALSHWSVADEKHLETAEMAIKLIAPLQFALMIWLSVTMGRELSGASFSASYITSIVCLFGTVVVEGIAAAALALGAGSWRSMAGLSLVSLINAKYAGLFGAIKQ